MTFMGLMGIFQSMSVEKTFFGSTFHEILAASVFLMFPVSKTSFAALYVTLLLFFALCDCFREDILHKKHKFGFL